MLSNVKVNIKRVDSMDIGPLREMSLAFAREENFDYPCMDETEIDKQMLYILMHKDDPNLIYLIAYAGKKPVGFGLSYIGMHEWSRPAKVLVGQELYVVPDKRGSHIAIRLAEKAFGLGIEQGVEGIECLGSYGLSDKRWEKIGFKLHLTYGHMPTAKFDSMVERFKRTHNSNV